MTEASLHPQPWGEAMPHASKGHDGHHTDYFYHANANGSLDLAKYLLEQGVRAHIKGELLQCSDEGYL